MRYPAKNRVAGFAAMLTALGLFLCAPGAQAAKVSVLETLGGAENLATLSFKAPPGEKNEVSIVATSFDRTNLKLKIVDAGAPLVAGAGCTGGGEPGSAVECGMRAPKWGDSEACGKGCARFIPGTSWRDVLDVDLGDGDNAFDSRLIPEMHGPDIAVNITAGAGEDKIYLGSGEDRIEPGAGSDEVHSGEGFDRIWATATPDGADLYENERSLDKISYAARSVPTNLTSTAAGASGEGDILNGLFHVVGGSADDVLDGGADDLILEGGPGDDRLSGAAPNNHLYGGPGDDRLDTTRASAQSLNHLVGEEGDDLYFGGEGSDFFRESEDHDDWGSRPEQGPDPVSGGNDSAFGGGGGDVFELRAGADVAYGEEGDDHLHGGMEADKLVAGPGNDQLIGGSGFDLLSAGRGDDRLFSGRWKWNVAAADSFPFSPVGNDRRDQAGCGAGRDLIFANPWDRLRSCEDVRLRPRPKARGRR